VVWTAGGTPTPAGKWLHLQKARLFFEKMLGYANHLGLYGEELGPQAQHLGNFPQAFTHLALISAACVVRLNPRIMRCADEAILVLNAGSSSMKVAVFAGRSGELALELRGAVDGRSMGSTPCRVSKRTIRRVVSSPRNHGAERPWVTKG
jgi:hypothetical protein